jgi:peptide deformylase
MLQALDEDGKIVIFDAQDLLACVCQHEIDHLLGKLIIDYAPLWKRIAFRKKLKEKRNI